jgi:peptidyl-prolyl cis-trans isomerase A (cyclophilin A)
MFCRAAVYWWLMYMATLQTVTGPRRALAALAPVLCLFLYGCSASGPSEQKPAAKTPEPPPEVYRVVFETSKGPFTVEVTRNWAPRGADHFYDLVQTGFYDGARFYRVVRNYVAQFGIGADDRLNRLWSSTAIPDDPVKQSNRKGTITYAMHGPGTRTTQVFINLKDNQALDKDGFAPFGKVVSGMEVVESFYNSYGDMPPRGGGPDPKLLETQGVSYLESRFPRLDFIRKASIAPPG